MGYSNIDEALTAIATDFRDEGQTLIADMLMPKTPVGGEIFRYFKFETEQNYIIPDTKIGRKSRPNILESFGVEAYGNAVDYWQDASVPIDDIGKAPLINSDDISLENIVKNLTRRIMLDREKRVAGMVQDSSNYATGQVTALTGAKRWDNEDSNPLNAILSVLDKPLMRPNIMVIGREAWTILRQHPKLISAVRCNKGESGAITRQQLADLLEIEQMLVGDSFINSVEQEATDSFTRIWGKHAAFLHINPVGRTVWGFTATYKDRMVRRIQDQNGLIIVRVGESCTEIVSAKHLSYLLQKIVN